MDLRRIGWRGWRDATMWWKTRGTADRTMLPLGRILCCWTEFEYINENSAVAGERALPVFPFYLYIYIYTGKKPVHKSPNSHRDLSDVWRCLLFETYENPERKKNAEACNVSIQHHRSAFPGDASSICSLLCFSCLVYSFLVCSLSFHHSFLLVDPELGSVSCGLAHFHSNLSIHERHFPPLSSLRITQRDRRKCLGSRLQVPRH